MVYGGHDAIISAPPRGRCACHPSVAIKIFGGSDTMKLQPLNDRVLVKRLETEEKTAE